MTESTEFCNAWSTSGSICVTCMCGRTYFATCANEGNFDEDELEGLRRNAAEQPDKYFEQPGESYISYLHIGKGIVIGCSCGKGTQYEEFIWQHRIEIADYLTARVKADLDAVIHVNEKLKQLNELQANQPALLLVT